MPYPKKTGEPFRKSTDAQIEIRRRIAFKLLLNGASRQELKQYYALEFKKTGNEYWNVADRTISSDIAAFKKEMEKLAIIHREEELGLARARLDNLYRRASNDNDIKTALAIEKTRIELFRLNEVLSDESDELLEELINALKQRVEARKSRSRAIPQLKQQVKPDKDQGEEDQGEED